MKALKVILSVLIVITFSLTTLGSKEVNAETNKIIEIDNKDYTQITNAKEIKTYQKQIDKVQKEATKQLNNEKINLENPGVFKDLTSNIVVVIYELHSNKVNLDSLSTISFAISDDTVVSQTLKVINLDNEQKHVTLVQNNKTFADFVVKNDTEYVSGWVLNPEKGKIDVTSSEYKEYQKDEIKEFEGDDTSKIQPFGINKCMDKCFDNSKIPSWLQTTINATAAVSCLFGPNPVCLAAITAVAASYGSKAITCAIECL